jgi:mannose-6-phosphate isomerase-like protein (cupin superfamily)
MSASHRGWEAVHLDAVPSIAGDPDEGAWKPLRHDLGISAFGVNAWTGATAGAQIIEPHDEAPDDEDPRAHEEVYVVLTGVAAFTVDGERFDAPAGTVVAIRDPLLRREASAREAGTTILTIGAAPGEAFTPSPWEQRALARNGRL